MTKSRMYGGDEERDKESAALFLPALSQDRSDSVKNDHSPTTTVTTTSESDRDVDDDDIVCGVGSFTPSCLQRCMTIGSFTMFYGVAGLLTSGLNVYISSQITTLEKYFNFSSSFSGFLMSCNDIGYLLTTLFMSYYSRRVHLPRALSFSTVIYGLSGIICVLAFAVTKDEHARLTSFHLKGDNASSDVDLSGPSFDRRLLCVNATPVTSSSTGEVGENDDEMSPSWRFLALAILVLGMAVQGMAKSPRHPFLGTFVDDNVPKTKSATYIGLITGFSIFGPALAFMLGGIFSRIYVTLENPGISIRDPRWLGAWWLGFLMFGGAAILAALPIACFPRRLRGRRQIEEAESQKTYKKMTTAVANDLKGFVKSFRRLLTNPVYTLMVFGTSIHMMAIAGFFAFAAKYLETQFTVPAFKANMTLGVLNVLSASFGTVLGGFLVSRLKLSPRACLKFKLTCIVLSSVALSLSFVFGCDQPYIHTVTDNLPSDGGSDSMQQCAKDCNCDTQNFFPVCGADNRNYFSPCHAGCDAIFGSNVFVNCTCVLGNTAGHADLATTATTTVTTPTTAATEAVSTPTAAAGLCTSNCNNFWFYFGAMFCYAFITTLTIMPNFVVYIRSVPEKDKPLALGFMAFTATIIGWMPGPMVFGYLVDTCCELWNGKGACVLYNLPNFRFRFHFLMLVLRTVSMIMLFAVFCIVTFSKSFEFQSHNDDHEEETVKVGRSGKDGESGKELESEGYF